MRHLFVIEELNPFAELPPPELVSAVALVAFDSEGRVLSTQHHDASRGWDLPGGHVEPGEGVLEALHREVWEEAGSKFETAVPIANLNSNETEGEYVGKRIYIFVVEEVNFVEDWQPHQDIAGRAFLEVETLLERYRGDREMLEQLIELAKSQL